MIVASGLSCSLLLWFLVFLEISIFLIDTDVVKQGPSETSNYTYEIIWELKPFSLMMYRLSHETVCFLEHTCSTKMMPKGINLGKVRILFPTSFCLPLPQAHVLEFFKPCFLSHHRAGTRLTNSLHLTAPDVGRVSYQCGGSDVCFGRKSHFFCCIVLFVWEGGGEMLVPTCWKNGYMYEI